MPDRDCLTRKGKGKLLGEELTGSDVGSFAFVRMGQRRIQVLQWAGSHPGERSWFARLSKETASHSSALQKPEGDSVLCSTPYYLTN